MPKQVAKRTATPQRSASKPSAANEYTLTALSGAPGANRIVSKSTVKRARPVAKKAANAKAAARKAAPKKTVAAKKAVTPKRAAAPKKAAAKPAAKKAGRR